MNLELLSNPIILIYFIVLIIYIVYFLRYLINSIQEERRRQNFINAFGNGLHSDMITDFNDVVNLYKSSFHKNAEDISHRYNLSNLLRHYLNALFYTSGIITLKDEDMKKTFERKKG